MNFPISGIDRRLRLEAPKNGSDEEVLREVKKKISQIRNYTPKVGVFGNSGVGKSSLCNALFGKEVAKISDVEACTRKPQEILISNSDNGGIILVDVPGIGEDPSHQEEYINLYKSLTSELDLVLWAIKADDRNYDSAIRAYQEVFKNVENTPPVVFVITQTDKTNPIKHWDQEKYAPKENLIANITAKEHDVSKRFEISCNRIISIAIENEDKKSYKLKELVELVVEVLPNEKKYSFTREAKEENVTEEARINAEKGIWDEVKEFCSDIWDEYGDKIKEFVGDKIKEFVIENTTKIVSVTAVTLATRVASWLR